MLPNVRSLNVASKETVKGKRDYLIHAIQSIQVADQAQHVTTGRRNRTCARCISTIRELVNRTLAKNVLTRRQEDCASKAQDCRMIRGAVLPVDKIRRTAQITGQATTIGEVLGRHV